MQTFIVIQINQYAIHFSKIAPVDPRERDLHSTTLARHTPNSHTTNHKNYQSISPTRLKQERRNKPNQVKEKKRACWFVRSVASTYLTNTRTDSTDVSSHSLVLSLSLATWCEWVILTRSDTIPGSASSVHYSPFLKSFNLLLLRVSKTQRQWRGCSRGSCVLPSFI